MLTKDEAQRIAAGINAARPDWSIPSLMAILADDRCRSRAYRDLFLAFLAMALDPTSQKPTRIYGEGPWWEASRPIDTPAGAALIRHPEPDDCDVCGHTKASPHIDHEYAPRHAGGHCIPLTDEQRDAIYHRLAEVLPVDGEPAP